MTTKTQREAQAAIKRKDKIYNKNIPRLYVIMIGYALRTAPFVFIELSTNRISAGDSALNKLSFDRKHSDIIYIISIELTGAAVDELLDARLIYQQEFNKKWKAKGFDVDQSPS